MTNEKAIKMLEYIRHTGNGESEYKNDAQSIALDMAAKALETVQRIDDVLNVEGMTEIDILDEIMDAVSEFKYDCGVSE